MSDFLANYACTLYANLIGRREEMRFAEEFGRSLENALVKIQTEFVRQCSSNEFPVCPISKIAGLAVTVEDLDTVVWSFRIVVKMGITEVVIWINRGPGIILFEFTRIYTPRTAVFKRAAVHFGQSNQPADASHGPMPQKMPKQLWTPDSLWLTESDATDAWVKPEKLAAHIMKHLMQFDMAEDLENAVEQRPDAN
jgi:hypothetical protein